MPRIFHRIDSNFNEDWFNEIEDSIEIIDDNNCKLIVRALLIKCRLDKTEKKIDFLSKWMRALNDSYTDLKQSIEIVELIISENEQKISNLVNSFNKLKIE